MTFQNNPNQIGSYDFVLLPSPCSTEFSHIRGAPSDAFWGMGWESGWNGWPPRRKGKKRINSGGFGWVSWMMTRLLLWRVLLWMLLHLGKMKCICIKYIYIDEIWMVILPSCSWSQNFHVFYNARTGPPTIWRDELTIFGLMVKHLVVFFLERPASWGPPLNGMASLFAWFPLEFLLSFNGFRGFKMFFPCSISVHSGLGLGTKHFEQQKILCQCQQRRKSCQNVEARI